MVPAVANSIISRAYSTPVGTIISLYGKTAPAGYLACDGATYNRDEYPDLAEYLVGQFEDLVGDGETTFAVPDLRGEFLRCTGTNSHTNCGSGDNVGVHQAPTVIPRTFAADSEGAIYSGRQSDYHDPDSSNMTMTAGDFARKASGTAVTVTKTSVMGPPFTIRPTNTSVLYCIKY